MAHRLEARIVELIAADGPLRIDSFMALALGDPIDGYYAAREPFGTAGDFITSPDISQLFGEVVGAWLIHAWRQSGSPAPFSLVEFGPGRATLLSDILRVGRLVPPFLEALQLHLVETSARLRKVQADSLQQLGHRACFHEEAGTLPRQPMLVIANEFFDALPIRQFVMTAGGWRERVIGLVDGRLGFGLAPGAPDQAPAVSPGDLVERSPARSALAALLGDLLSRYGGVGLIIDYGYLGPAPGDTLQAVRAHRYADPLDAPGSSDLTAHVDFTDLQEAFRSAGVVTYGPLEQGDFLGELGIVDRAERLKAGKDGALQRKIDRDLQRLVAPGQMGRLFKVLAVANRPLELPPFSPPSADKPENAL